MKVLLILADGMRPDSLAQVELAQKILRRSAYSLTVQTVMPSATLPCHMSLFHSVDPARHGTTTNTYAPQVRPIRGLFEVLKKAKKRSAFFYDWEELRDLARPGKLDHACFYSGDGKGWLEADDLLTERCIAHLKEEETDFAFLYMGSPDAYGHGFGWMGKEYMAAVENCWKNIEKVHSSLSEEWTVIITADHGGHNRTHGTEMAEDMTIPLLLLGKPFAPAELAGEVSIKDIAPTVTALFGIEPDEEWEGKSLL